MIECRMNFGTEGQELLVGVGTQMKAFKRQQRSWQLLLGIGGGFVLVCAILGKNIPMIILGILLLAAAVCARSLLKAGMRQAIKKRDPRSSEGSRDYTISDSGIDIVSYAGDSHTTWDAYNAYGSYQHYIWIQRADNNVVVIDCNALTEAQNAELQGYLEKYLPAK